MATPSSEGQRRRKRAWRKPREAIGPGDASLPSEQRQKIEEEESRLQTEHAQKQGDSQTGPGPGNTILPASERPQNPNEFRLQSEHMQQQTESEAIESGSASLPASKQGASLKQKTEETSQLHPGHVQQQQSSGSHGYTESGRSLQPASPVDTTLVEIDGSVMEGGGQILRNAMAVSCLLGRPIHITRIRAGRSTPGLRAQHLTGIQLISDLCRGRLEGDRVGSTEVNFDPQAIQSGNFLAAIGTAGSICLLLQAALPCLLFAPRPSQVTLKGGTNADMAPPIDYLTMVFKPIAAKFGIHFDCQLKKRGFFPKGGGEVIVTPYPVKNLSPVQITDPGCVTSIKIHSFVAGAVNPKVARQMCWAARQVVERQLAGVPVEEEETQETAATARGNGSGIIVLAETSTGCLLAGSANGRKGEPAEKTGRSAAEELVRNVKAGGCVDEHLQDQLVILMALAGGRSVVRTGPVTLHTQTAIHIAELMTRAKFVIKKLEGEAHLMKCDGIGLGNRNL